MIVKHTSRFAVAGIVGSLLASGCVSLESPDDSRSTMTAMHKACMEHAAVTAGGVATPERADDAARAGMCPMMDKKSTASTEEKPAHEH